MMQADVTAEQLRESDTDVEDSDRMFLEMLTALVEHLQ